MREALSKAKQIVKDCASVRDGFRVLSKTKKTPETSYQAMRQLFVETNGRSNDIISSLIRKKKYLNVELNGVLEISSNDELNSVVADIDQNGFHIFKSKLSDDKIEKIVEYARSAPCTYRKISNVSGEYSISLSDEVLFDENDLQSPVYQFSRQTIINNEELQKLIFDQSLLGVAQKYLDTKPIMDLAAMWWSVPFHGKGKSEAAQMYHFDLDRIKFIKFFFYLTNVDSDTGPHCYVRGSHKKLPPALRKDGRMTDEEVKREFGAANLLELCGDRGTIMAADTRGLHKGKDLLRDKRLIFQVEFANSMFGQYYPPCKKPILSSELERRYENFKFTYQEMMV